ncbi:MAG: DUF697 domain-containing protein [Candidatus Sericytochromatia bacterium]|nr:DUF697 domain-containing protein [Candidatus Sericytochromatia bacterium]
MAVPAQMTELLAVWREISGDADRQVPVNLYAPLDASRDALRLMFLAGSAYPETLNILELGPTHPPEADLHLVMVEASYGPSGQDLGALKRLPPGSLLLLLVMPDERLQDARRREVAATAGVRADRVVVAGSVSELRPLLARRLTALFKDHAVSLARQFPFVREEAVSQEIAATSQQNAMVGVIPVPGADLPVMTLNQIKMVMRLATIHDQPLSYERLREVLAVVGGGFALRTVARQVAKLIPGPGWLVAGGLGYAGTLAMGKAAAEYFRRSAKGAPGSPALGPDGRPVIDTKATVVDPTEPA